MNTLSTLLSGMLDIWRAEGVRFGSGVAPERLREFQRNHGIVLPTDLVSYLTLVDGMQELDCDGRLIHFWPLETYRRVGTYFPTVVVPGEGDLVVFADYLLHSALIVIRVNSASSDVHLTYGVELRRIAGSFVEFLELYVMRSSMLLGT